MEIWKPIPGYEGIYDASDLGRIRTTPGKTTSNKRYSVRVWQTRVLKPKQPIAAKRHDKRVTLWKDGQRRDYLVSRLVAMAWYGIPEPGMTVNHKNGDYMDNRPQNLEWISLADNVRHGFETGLFKRTQKAVTLLDGDGNSIRFSSMAECDRWLGRNSGYISLCAKRGSKAKDLWTGKEYLIEVAA